MPGQNINNYYFKKLIAKLSEQNYYDITLSSDKGGYNSDIVFSDDLIWDNNGDILPINIDLNYIMSNQKLELDWGVYYSGNTLVSKNYYNPNDDDLSCETATTVCDIGLTATDNGLYDRMSGETLTFTMGINENETFNPHYYDRRFKMHPITGYTDSPNVRFSGNTERTLYNIVSKENEVVGYYNELYGGFYQGFYKLFGYDYETFPERVNKGWSTQLLLKPRFSDEYTPETGETYLNNVYPENAGTFFFMGTRAENKYYHPASGSPESLSGYTRVTEDLTDCIKTCACADTGVTNSDCITVYPQTATTQTHNTGGCGASTEEVPVDLQEPDMDLFSNGFSIRFSGEPQNPRICVKYIKFTGDCITTGTCENTGLTYSSGYTIVEECSEGGIYGDCDLSDCILPEDERWVMITAVFSRYRSLEDCDLLNIGGLGDVRKLLYPSEVNGASYNIIMPPHTHEGSESEQLRSFIKLNEKWFENRIKRLGNLQIYVNRQLFMTINDFEEIIPHELNTEKEKQLGVPFNISLGGGTQGLRESLVFDGCDSPFGPYIQDPELMPNQTLSGTSLSGLSTNIIMEPNFGGSFMGAIAQFRMYTKPLSAPEVQHNYRILKDRFDLYDYWCDECQVCSGEVPTPSVTPTITVSPSVTPTIGITTTPSLTTTPSITSTPSVTTSTSITTTPSVTTTPGLSPTSTSSVTPTISITSSITATPSLTATPSVTTTLSSTPTPSLTATSSITVTPSVTTTPGLSPTSTSSVTPTISITSSITATPSLTATPSVTTTPTITPSTSTEVEQTFNVSAIGAAAYNIDGNSNPTLTLTRNKLYLFSINSPGHPFYIKTQTGTGTGNQYNDGVTNNGTSNGTLSFFVPSNAPDTLYYQCSIHSSMNGIINIIYGPVVTPTNTPTPSTTSSVSVTPSVSNTPTSSVTPSTTSSVSVTPSVSNTPTSSVTPSVTTTSSITPTPSQNQTTVISYEMGEGSPFVSGRIHFSPDGSIDNSNLSITAATHIIVSTLDVNSIDYVNTLTGLTSGQQFIIQSVSNPSESVNVSIDVGTYSSINPRVSYPILSLNSYSTSSPFTDGENIELSPI